LAHFVFVPETIGEGTGLEFLWVCTSQPLFEFVKKAYAVVVIMLCEPVAPLEAEELVVGIA
jgi:hypothetical protein